MTEQQITSIDLSQDELAFIMTLYNLNEISGFTVPTDFDGTAASAAGDSLAARGLAVEGEGGQTIHPDIAALVTIGALYSVAIGLSIPNGGSAPVRHWFYFAPERTVYHSKPKLGVEHFELLDGSDDFANRLARLLSTGNNGNKPGFAGFSVPKSILAQAETVKAGKGPAAAADTLKVQNLPESFAANVLDENAQIIVVIIRVSETARGEVQADTNTTMLITTSSGYWLLQEDERDSDVLTANPVDGMMALEFLAQLSAL